MIFTLVFTCLFGLLFLLHAIGLIHELYLKSRPDYSRGPRMLQALVGVSLIDLALFLFGLLCLLKV